MFSGYFIKDNDLYRDKEGLEQLDTLLQTNSCTEVIAGLNGSFRFIIESESHTHFGIDHFGGYSLFYKSRPSLEIFTNPNSLSSLSDIQDDQLCTLLASGFCFGDKTIFRDIKECLPGRLYSYDKSADKLTSKQWFQVDFSKQRKRSKAELSDLFFSLIPNNLSKTTLALTGGIDSRLLLSLFKRKGIQLETLTYGTRDNSDIKLARQIAQESGLDHNAYYFDELNLTSFFQDDLLDKFLTSGFLGRSLPFESDWVVSNLIKDSTQWISTGFTSFWLRAPYQDYLPVRDNSSLVNKLVNSHCQQTLISSSSFRDTLIASINESMSHYNSEDYDRSYDRWNIENRQHKYIINTCNNYRYNNIEVFMPLFDRRVMTFLNNTSREQRLEQKLFMETIISNIFTGNDAYLKKIPSTNPKFTNNLQKNKLSPNKLRNKILHLDKHNLNRIFRRPNNPMYGIIRSVLLQSPDYLSLKVDQAFPNIKETISLLYDLNLTKSANHLNWLKNKKVVQLNLLGIEIIGFLVDKFSTVLSSTEK